MTPGPISEVPGFRRPEPQDEPSTPTRQVPLINAVPGIVHAVPSQVDAADAGGGGLDRPDATAPLTAVPLTVVPLAVVPLADVPTPTPAAVDPLTFATQPVTLPPVAPARDAEFAASTPPHVPQGEVLPPLASPPAPLTGPAPTVAALASPLEINLWGESSDVTETADAEDLDATRVAQRSAILVLRWDDFTVLRATTATVVGRDPVATGADEAVALDDPSRSLSKAHARFTAGLAPTVEDIHSTNGVRIDRDGAAITVVPGEPVPLRHGDDVVCGTRRATVEVRA
jgi:hypothetical protein